VTLVGPGGVGKTRLALELARSIGDEFRDGAPFVSLAPVGSFEDVARTMVRQLDVVLLPSESAEQGLARHLGDQDVLLVLDNFEHVLDAAGLVADLLAATSRLRVLVTSREPLRLRAERLFRLDPLAPRSTTTAALSACRRRPLLSCSSLWRAHAIRASRSAIRTRGRSRASAGGSTGSRSRSSSRRRASGC
jgi:predicted ATPase